MPVIARQKGGMRRIGLLILALAVAVTTSFVPPRQAAKAAHSLAAAMQQVDPDALAANDAPALPMKRCQSGAGLLGCPFEEPGILVAMHDRIVSEVRFTAYARILTGRAADIESRPPKPNSAPKHFI